MTEIIDLFKIIVEHYGQTAALSTLIVTVIVYGVYLLLKNYSSLIKTYLENKLEDKKAITSYRDYRLLRQLN